MEAVRQYRVTIAETRSQQQLLLLVKRSQEQLAPSCQVIQDGRACGRGGRGAERAHSNLSRRIHPAALRSTSGHKATVISSDGYGVPWSGTEEVTEDNRRRAGSGGLVIMAAVRVAGK